MRRHGGASLYVKDDQFALGGDKYWHHTLETVSITAELAATAERLPSKTIVAQPYADEFWLSYFCALEMVAPLHINADEFEPRRWLVRKTGRFAAVAAVVLASGAFVVAQDSSAPQTGAAAPANEQKVVAVGCLRPAETTTPVATTISVVAYTLTNASITKPGSTVSPEATASAAASGKSMTYALAAENLEELKTHENKRVEIVGRMSPALTALPTPGAEARSAKAAGAVGTAGSTAKAVADAPRIRVDAVKVVAGSCDAK
jgi:hypothetical protein